MADEKTPLEVEVEALETEVDAGVEAAKTDDKKGKKPIAPATLEEWHARIAALERKSAPSPAPAADPGEAKLKALRKRVYAL